MKSKNESPFDKLLYQGKNRKVGNHGNGSDFVQLLPI